MKHKHNESGVAHIVLIGAALVIAVAGLTAYRVVSKEKEYNTTQGTSRQQSSYDGSSQANSAACIDNPTIKLPVDISTVESILYPGQVRGGNYKPHGGFRLNSPDNSTSVTLPLDAKLIAGARYIEAGEVQYMFDFETDCKIRLRFDHLAVLSSDLQAEADKLPQPKVDDSRTTNLEGKPFKVGVVLATKVGFVKNNNVSFDFGMYDYNKANKISSDSEWAKDPQHQFDNAKHGVCWFDYLSAEDHAAVAALPATDQTQGKTSDYCN